MSEPDRRSTLALCNAGLADLYVWLEPWADECKVPPKGELVLEIEGAQDSGVTPEFDQSDYGLIVYASGGTRIRVLVDGCLQETASAMVECPDMDSLTTRDFVGIVFGGFPETRPGGIPPPGPEGLIRRILRKLGL